MRVNAASRDRNQSTTTKEQQIAIAKLPLHVSQSNVFAQR
jgi:hypothetical protein